MTKILYGSRKKSSYFQTFLLSRKRLSVYQVPSQGVLLSITLNLLTHKVNITLSKAKHSKYLSISRPTWPAPDAAGAAPNLWRFMLFVLCRQPWRFTYPPAAQVRPSVGPPKTDMLHFTVARTRIRRKFCTRTHENARPNHQKETEASIVLHLKTKYPVRTVRHTQRRQSFYI